MKIIFLDVDGVLNSQRLMEQWEETGVLLDEENIACLKEIVEATGAKIVLTSTWRTGWSPVKEEVDEACAVLVDMLAKYDLQIMDKTPVSESCRRENEIKAWMDGSKEKIHRFVILDDAPYQWHRQGYDANVVKTSFDTGGLRKEHVGKAIQILNKKTLLERLFSRRAQNEDQ